MGAIRDGPWLLFLDSLKTHKMTSVRERLKACCTEVEFIPPGITGLAQPMDVAVMKSFKNACRRKYLDHHLAHPFAANATERRALISKIVLDSWRELDGSLLTKGFAKAGLMPTGPRQMDGSF